MPVVLMNTNSYKVWVRQPLLAADLVEVEHHLWDYQPSMSREGDEVTVSFHPVPSQEVQEDILSSAVNSTQDNSNNINETIKRTTFGPRPDVNDSDLDFAKELDQLSFPVNLGDVEMMKAQQIRFLQLVYDNQSVFSLCDEDLGPCDHLKHTIPTTMDKLVYLPRRTIPVQLQAEVHKCLDAWLRQVSFTHHIVLMLCKW